jgi:large subunit ribosomal protein L18
MSENIKTEKRIRIKNRIRSKIFGTAERPRLSVFRSNKFIYAQIIDDIAKKTLGQVNDMKVTQGNKTERAKELGKKIAEISLAKKINQVVFDRNGFKYTGRIKLMAEAARANGLKF